MATISPTSSTPASFISGERALNWRAFCAPVENAALLASWLWLSAPTIAWLTKTFAQPSSRTNAVLLGCAVLLLAVRAAPRLNLRGAAFAQPRLHFGPLGLLGLSALGQFLKPLLLDSNILASICFALGSYGLVGLYLPPVRWNRWLVGVLFAISLLPFGTHLDAFLGFPARIATARLVELMLQPMGVAVQSTESILILENGVANIDLPCSGVKGLWVGSIFFLALTCLERRAVGVAWLVAGTTYMASLMAANLVRVLILVVVAVACQQPQVAELIHLPLGVFGFVASSALAIFLLRRLPAHAAAEPPAGLRAPSLSVGVLLCAVLLSSLALARGAARQEAGSFEQAHVQFPTEWVVSSVPLAPAEKELFGRHEAQNVSKWRFQFRGLNGSLLVVVADSFRAHHAPEVCLAGSGHRIDEVRIQTIPGGFPIKLIELDHHHASAVYWFQSPTLTTDALIERTLAEVIRGDRRWALVSVLFDKRNMLDEPTSELLKQLHTAVRDCLVAPTRRGN